MSRESSAGRILASTYVFAVSRILLTVFSVGGNALAAHADATGRDALGIVRALLAGVKEWEAEVSFVGSYREEIGIAKSLETASLGEFTGTPDSEWSGTACKMGDLIRLSQEYPNGPEVLKIEMNAGVKMGTLKNISSDEVTDGKFQIMYHPLKGGDSRGPAYGGYADVLLRDVGQNGPMEAGLRTRNVLSPLQYEGRSPSNLLELAIEDIELHNGTLAVKNASKDVEVTSTRPGAVSISRTIQLSTEFGLPTVIKYEEVQTSNTDKFTIRVLASDSVQSGNSMVPRKIISIGAPADEQACRVKVWQSLDLGNRLPTRDDFVIRVPEGTRIRGLNPSARVKYSQALDITNVSTNDLEEQLTAIESGSLVGEGKPKGSRLALVLTAAVVSVLLLLVIAKRWIYCAT